MSRSYLIKNSRVPSALSWFFPVAAVTLGPFIFVRRGSLTPRLVTHEKIHVAQGRELFFVGFWFLYLYYWARGLYTYRNACSPAVAAYRAIPFEREAYHYEADPGYLSKRRPHTWRRFS